MKILGCVLIAAVCMTAGPVLAKKKKEEAVEPAPAAPTAAAAGQSNCTANYKQEGGYIMGRRFSTWDVVPGVTPAVAYKRIYMEGVKSGLKVSSSDEKMGAIVFEQMNAGSSFGSDQMLNIPWNVFIEAEGKGVKISVTKSTPPSYATSKDFQMKSMCAVIDAVRNK